MPEVLRSESAARYAIAMTQNTEDSAPRFRCTGRDCAGLVIVGHGDRDAHDLVRHGGRELTRPVDAPAGTEQAQR